MNETQLTPPDSVVTALFYLHTTNVKDTHVFIPTRASLGGVPASPYLSASHIGRRSLVLVPFDNLPPLLVVLVRFLLLDQHRFNSFPSISICLPSGCMPPAQSKDMLDSSRRGGRKGGDCAVSFVGMCTAFPTYNIMRCRPDCGRRDADGTLPNPRPRFSPRNRCPEYV